MRFVQEFRDRQRCEPYRQAMADLVTRPWTVMEVCGGQTHSIVKYGLDQLLPPEVTLIHGPGCPVCVTPVAILDQAIALAQRPEVIFTSFGDMLRVPGSRRDLLSVRAEGGDVRLVYSPLDALEMAQHHPGRSVVFFAVGFETTAPSTAMALHRARMLELKNFFVLSAHVLVPPAIASILRSPDNRIEGFLAAGHVCTVMGEAQYHPLARNFEVPLVITGFEPLDILQGLYRCLELLERGEAVCDNQYRRSVRSLGNRQAQALMEEVFQVVDRPWRGFGTIPQSGLGLRPEFAPWDAMVQWGDLFRDVGPGEDPRCLSGAILQGQKKPQECPAFGSLCTPEHPLGAPMVSSEGACAAYYRYRLPSPSSVG